MKREFEVTYLYRPANLPRSKRAVRIFKFMQAETIFELFAQITAEHVSGDYKPPIRIVRIEELPPYNARKEN